jgi:hypothetical protein
MWQRYCIDENPKFAPAKAVEKLGEIHCELRTRIGCVKGALRRERTPRSARPCPVGLRTAGLLRVRGN